MNDPAVADIAEAWQQRWPTLRLACLYASPGESARGLPAVLLALELAAARFATSDATVARGKLAFWAGELALAGGSRHPLARVVAPAPAAQAAADWFIDDLEQDRAEDIDALLQRWLPVSDSLARACGGDEHTASLFRVLWATSLSLSVAESLPLAAAPLAVLAAVGKGPAPELGQALARAFGGRFRDEWAGIPALAFDGRRGQRVLALETISDLAHARVFAPPPGPVARLARAFRGWRAASGLS